MRPHGGGARWGGRRRPVPHQRPERLRCRGMRAARRPGVRAGGAGLRDGRDGGRSVGWPRGDFSRCGHLDETEIAGRRCGEFRGRFWCRRRSFGARLFRSGVRPLRQTRRHRRREAVAGRHSGGGRVGVPDPACPRRQRPGLASRARAADSSFRERRSWLGGAVGGGPGVQLPQRDQGRHLRGDPRAGDRGRGRDQGLHESRHRLRQLRTVAQKAPRRRVE